MIFFKLFLNILIRNLWFLKELSRFFIIRNFFFILRWKRYLYDIHYFFIHLFTYASHWHLFMEHPPCIRYSSRPWGQGNAVDRLGPWLYGSCLLNSLERQALRPEIIMHSGRFHENGNTIIYRQMENLNLIREEKISVISAEGKAAGKLCELTLWDGVGSLGRQHLLPDLSSSWTRMDSSHLPSQTSPIF